MTFAFEDFELDVARAELCRQNCPIDIDPKPFALLSYLVLHRDRAVPKQELFEQVWPDVFVSETALSSALKDLRRALGDDGATQRLIRTHRRRGYRFVGAVVDRSPSARGGRLAAIDRITRRSKPDPMLSGREVLPFVGRSLELASLEEHVREASKRVPRVVVVTGEAGSGKTRLVRELLTTPVCAGFEVVFGHSSEATPLPYRAFLEALSNRLSLGDESTALALGDDEVVLRRLLHPSAADPKREAAPLSQVDGERERLELFEALSRSLQRLAQRRPSLVVLEDLHWADAASWDLLLHLASTFSDQISLSRVALLIIVTMRPPESGQAFESQLQRLYREPSCKRVEVSGFDDLGIQQILTHLGLAHAPSSSIQTLAELTHGNPLFIQEIVRSIDSPDQLMRPGSEGDGTLALPDDLLTAISMHIDRLSEACREILAVASFIGDRFGLLALSAACRRPLEEIELVLAEAKNEGLLLVERRTCRFAHPLVRHVLRGLADDTERPGIHRDIADVLEDLYATSGGEHAMEIADHLVHAQSLVDPARLERFARIAGDQAFAVFAWRQAARYYTAALECGQELTATERATLHLRAAVAYNHAWEAGPCVDHYEQAVSGFRKANDVVGLAWALMYLTRARFTIASVSYGEKLDLVPLEGVVDLLGTRHPALRALVLETLAEAHWTAGEAERAEDIAGRALVIGHNLDEDSVCHHACMGLALARFSQMRVSDAVESWREALAHARRAHDPWLLTTPGPRLAMALLHLGRLEEAKTFATESVAAARRAQNMGELSFAFAQQASIELARGDLRSAESSATSAVALIDRSRYPWGGPFALSTLASAATLRGQTDTARRALAQLLEPGVVFAEPGPSMHLMVAIFDDLITATISAHPLIDVERLENLLKLCRTAGTDIYALAPLCAITEIAVRVGAPHLCEYPEQVLRFAFEQGVRFTTGWVFGVSRILGLIAGARGKPEEAFDWLDRAEETAREAGATVELAGALVARARFALCRAARGDSPRAETALREARQLLNASAAEAAIAEVDALLERVGRRPRTGIRARAPR